MSAIGFDLAPRRCPLEPIGEIWAAARLLGSAATAHADSDAAGADRLIREADMPAIRAWTVAIWAKPDERLEMAARLRQGRRRARTTLTSRPQSGTLIRDQTP